MKRWTVRPPGSNWGDFGVDDQRGRMNMLTPERVLRAVAEVREGRVFCLSLPLNLPGGNALNPKRFPPTLGSVYRDGEPYFNYAWERVSQGNLDVTSDESVTLHSQYSTQWDGLAHVGQSFDCHGDGNPEPTYYNGYRGDTHITGPGTGTAATSQPLDIQNMAATGVQGRAVLVDLHAHFGDQRIAVNHAMLMEIFSKDGISVEPGDILLLHTGWDDLILAMQGEPDAGRLHASGAVLDGYDDRLLNWITDSGLCAIASDNMAVEDSLGSGTTIGGGSRLPLHRHCLFRLGIHLGELWYLSELAGALRERDRFRCLLTAPPLRMPGAVGSPVTPIATI